MFEEEDVFDEEDTEPSKEKRSLCLCPGCLNVVRFTQLVEKEGTLGCINCI